MADKGTQRMKDLDIPQGNAGKLKEGGPIPSTAADFVKKNK